MTRTITISSNLYNGYKHIHMLNGYNFPTVKATVFKYMPLNRFIANVDNQELVFVSPELWYDPFEQLYYRTDYSSHSYLLEDIACLCLSEKSSTNEDASWRVYADSSKKAVRISINIDKLLTMLENYATTNGFEVYIGQVNYEFEKAEIQGLHKRSSLYYNTFFPNPMSREHYLSLMLLKRSAFKYENEVRIFLVKDKISFNNELLCIHCDYKANSLITNIMLSPYPPIRERDDLAFKVRQKLNNIESNELKRTLQVKVGCGVQQSLLYKVCNKVMAV